MSAPIEVNGKKIDYAQKFVGFLLDKLNKELTSISMLRNLFSKMNNDGIKPEFIEFFINNYDRIIDVSIDSML